MNKGNDCLCIKNRDWVVNSKILIANHYLVLDFFQEGHKSKNSSNSRSVTQPYPKRQPGKYN